MARLSRDDSSWKAHGLKKRYANFDPDASPKPKAKKDTIRWCRGVEGREHQIRSVVIGIQHRWGVDHGDKPCNCKRTVEKCINCNAKISSWKLSRKAAKVATDTDTTQKELAAKWCTEGHLWDWKPFDNSDPVIHYVVVDGEIRTNQGRKPWRMPRVHRYCVMCGLERKSQSRQITPEDL